MTPPDADATGAGAAIDQVVGGRFALDRLLAHSNEVATYTGVDTVDGGGVIVKIVATVGVSIAARLRLEHEANVLQNLVGATFRPLLASGHDGQRFYLVQPRLEGRTLHDRLEDGPLPVRTALHVICDVLDVLQRAHDQGVLHRDVKPANIIVRGGVPVERGELIDFGLAYSAGLDVSLRNEPVGTARYLAPEACGLIELGVDTRSDLYSLGVVLFECLAGRPPFGGDTVGEVLRHHLNTPPPHLRALGVAVPRAVDGVVQRLLTKDPDGRYQSASSVVADITEIIDALDAGVAEPAVAAGLHDRRHALTEPSFVGRADVLATLTGLLDRAARADGGLVLVEAESGGGKTRLLDEVALQAARQHFWVLRGQGVDRGAQRPFQVLDNVVNGIVAAATDSGGSAAAADLRDRLGVRAAATAAALPGLAATLGTADQAELGPEEYGEARSLDALTVLLDSLGRPDRPVLVILDDCQWADGLTIALLRRWQARRAGAAGGHVLVVAAFRTDEVPAGHALRRLAPLTTVALAPFGAGDVAALCSSMAGPLPDGTVATVVRLAEGSPFMASAVLRGMVESGALRDTPTGWEVDPGPMQDVQTSRRAALLLTRRFELLGHGALTLLTMGAVLGKEFDLGLAVALTGQAASEVTPALDELKRRRILWVDDGPADHGDHRESHCSFAHDKLRETLLGRLATDECRDLHRRAAERIEASDPERVFELAYHFDAAGEHERALPYALRSADLARSRHSLDVAVTQYRIAERAAATRLEAGGPGGSDTAVRVRIAEGLGDVLTLQGDYAEASRLLEHALSLTSGAVERAVLDGKLGDVAFKTGDQDRARRYLEGALGDLGRRVPRTGLGQVLAALKEVVIQALHTLVPRLFVARRSLEGAEREFLAIRMYSRLTYVYWFSAGKVPCAWAHLREMNLAERYPPTPELAQAYSEHAPVMTMAPWYSRGITYAHRSYEIRHELGDVWGQGQSLNFAGVVRYASSRYRECIAQCRESVRLLERTGDRWEQNTATWHLVFSHYRLGELDTAVELARELYATATAIGDHTASGVVLSGWARAASGVVPEEFVAAELARDNGDAQTASEVHLADGLRLLHEGELDRAVERLEQAATIVAAAGLRQEYVAPVKPWLVTALRMQIEAGDVHAPRTRARRLRRAARIARQADRLSRSYRNNRPHALRERALVANLRGRPARAERLLARSLAVAEAQGAAYEAVLTREAGARLAVAAGRAGATADLARAVASRVALEPDHPDAGRATGSDRPTLSLADRFESLLSVSRRIGAAPSPAAVYDAVREAALLLLRGDHCHVIELHGEVAADLTTQSEETVGELSRSVVDRAIEHRAVVVSGAGERDSSESLLLAGLTSVLCAPIVSDGEVIACFYLTHRHVHDLFGAIEVQLAEFIATLAGAALEHVAGSEARFRSLAQHSSDVITIVDRTGCITYQSSSLERVFGYQPEDLVGQELRSWLHPEDTDLQLALTAPPADVETARLVRARMRHRDGSWRDVETAVTPMDDDPGVRGHVLNTRDVSDRVALESELRIRAWHDPLTGLANRALFTDRVDAALAPPVDAGAGPDPDRPAVAFLDLDDFKSINDTLGHGAGDLLLTGVGERLRGCVRPGDTVARFGGDEFAVLLLAADDRTAGAVVARIIAELAHPFRILDREVHARASIGLALACGTETADDLLSAADIAMYVAKARGKGHYEVFEPEMRDVAVERSGLRNDLEWALPRDELVICYQPVFDVLTGALRGFEALLRWDHPTRGLLGPGEFIDLAERSGLIVPIGGWVLRRACLQAATWRRTHGRDLTMAVNVSARQLQDPGLVDEIVTALREAALDPDALVLEITESATVDDTEGAIARLAELKGLGVGLAIDDFGTGFSSLSYLRRFPVDQLKVDRSFVAGVTTNAEDLAIVASVVNLAHALDISVVAEGVETLDQLDKLCEMGCDLAQGFNWLRPVDAISMDGWLRALYRLPMVARPGGDVRVLLVDDQEGVRATLRIALDVDVEYGFTVVGEAAGVEDTLLLAERLRPDLIVLDIDMPGATGVEALPALRRVAPDATIVLLTVGDPAAVAAAGGAAADGLLLKSRDLGGFVRELAALVTPSPA